jgi:hypothetical protein
MKYKVVKNEEQFSCDDCVMLKVEQGLGDYYCERFMEENNLPDCILESCHFELADEITTVDLREIDKANDENTK